MTRYIDQEIKLSGYSNPIFKIDTVKQIFVLVFIDSSSWNRDYRVCVRFSATAIIYFRICMLCIQVVTMLVPHG